MTTYFLTERKATATMRVDDLLAAQQQQNQQFQQQNQQFFVNPHPQMVQQHLLQQQAQYSNIGSQNCKYPRLYPFEICCLNE